MKGKKKNDDKLLQIRLNTKTQNRLDELGKTTGISNKTQLVNCAIDLFSEVSDVLQNGGKVVYRHEDGTEERLKILGF